jgi:hypothetical protein
MRENDPPVLILAPTGRDAEVASSILEEAGLRAETGGSFSLMAVPIG